MSNLPIFFVTLLLYVLCARLSLSLSTGRSGARLFAFGNIAAFAWLSLLTRYDPWLETTILDLGASAIARHIFLILCYVGLVAIGYGLMRAFAAREGGLPWLAFFYPIAILIAVRYLYGFWNSLIERLDWDSWVITAALVGLSYMAFRLSRLVLEVRNRTVEMPSLSEYLGFAFFLPTLLVGPINSYANHQNSVRSITETRVPVGRCLFRILIGATKFLYLANLANQLSYTGIFLDGKPHALIDLAVAVVFYFLYLYCNFSGICDIAIGVAGLVGIRVSENFDNPLAARNVKEFWNRWHITLSDYAKEIVFAPLSKFLVIKLGAKYTNASIAIAVTTVFLVIGVWHGVGWRFAIFGLVHAAAVVANHYYTVWMKKALGKERFKRYNDNLLINTAAKGLTFAYVAASFAIFANDRNMLGIIKNALRSQL